MKPNTICNIFLNFYILPAMKQTKIITFRKFRLKVSFSTFQNFGFPVFFKSYIKNEKKRKLKYEIVRTITWKIMIYEYTLSE